MKNLLSKLGIDGDKQGNGRKEVDGAIRGDSLLLLFLVRRLWSVPL